MEIVAGQIVQSRRGRDVTHLYMVVGVEGDRLLLCDGDKRPLSAPKRKNIRHIMPTNTHLTPQQASTDLTLKKALAGYADARGAQTKGG